MQLSNRVVVLAVSIYLESRSTLCDVPIAYFLPGGSGSDFSASEREAAYRSLLDSRVVTIDMIVSASDSGCNISRLCQLWSKQLGREGGRFIKRAMKYTA